MTSAPTTHNLDDLLVFETTDWETGDTFSAGNWDTPILTMKEGAYRGVELTRRYYVFGWEAGSRQRLVQDGPLVEGPRAFLQQKPTAVTAHRQPVVTEIPVEVGDHLIIRGIEYVIGAAATDIELERV